MYVKLETSRLDYFHHKQKEIRVELYQGIIDSIEDGENRGCKVGRRIILPSSFIGGPRDMRKRYMDAMTLVQRFGKPDIFLTMTCNPNWYEIKQELGPNDEVQNRPDLVVRIFRAKLEELKKDLFIRQIFGGVAAYVYVIEFQKRGLLHAHLLIILKPNSKIYGPENFDKIVSAEIPHETHNSHLYTMVVKHMIHGPCGSINPKNVCMKKEGKCRNRYPKSFCSITTQAQNAYPRYKRCDDGKHIQVRGTTLDNRWVVPCNPFSLAKFDCHINVEICSTIKAVKYLYKYIYKGHDHVAFNITSSNDESMINEIDHFQSARWILSPEATWRIYGFTLNEIYPAIYSLQLHLEDKQLVTFNTSTKLSHIVQSDVFSRSMLTEFFRLNSYNEATRTLLYKEFPENFVWNQQQKIWTPRKKGVVIGRVVSAYPTEGERYYLRLLLNHIRGASSFDDLKTFNNIRVTTFRELAMLHGLLESDNAIEQCLEEASINQMPCTLR
ncbi:uncharacterized protein LOC133832974 [Humulus lupulus]|uniref:uncharacterized protein LOC133832974 n=1 Tax=Humulus lupulus TaxID=3486 RepID=UPI002B40F5AE|nr:uncharacterized protein LOC133832974 [Humulus lupulus]